VDCACVTCAMLLKGQANRYAQSRISLGCNIWVQGVDWFWWYEETDFF
jgi:hypothetical protein